MSKIVTINLFPLQQAPYIIVQIRILNSFDMSPTSLAPPPLYCIEWLYFKLVFNFDNIPNRWI